MLLGGDVGGTKTLLAIEDGARRVLVRRYENREYAQFTDLLAAFMSDAGAQGAAAVTHACFAVAGPIHGGSAQLTNRPDWQLVASSLALRFALGRVRLINDFAAAAFGIAALAPHEIATLQVGEHHPGGLRLAIGPGTGLGVAAIAGGQLLASEGGHVGFAPADGQQADLWRFLGGEHRRITTERICSGQGLAACYSYCLMRAGHALATHVDAIEVERRAREDRDPDALHALELFSRILGAVAGDMALTFLALGGVYVLGGIAPKILSALRAGGFIEAFNDKAEHAPLAARMPVHVALVEDAGLRGALLVAAEMPH